MAKDRKRKNWGDLPICILKTLIKHCALIYFDDIFRISQRCSTSPLFHIELNIEKVYFAVFKTSAENQGGKSKLSTTMTKIFSQAI